MTAVNIPDMMVVREWEREKESIPTTHTQLAKAAPLAC